MRSIPSEVTLLFLFGFLVAPLLVEVIKRRSRLIELGIFTLSVAVSAVLGFLAVVRSTYAATGSRSILHVVFDALIVFALSQLAYKYVIDPIVARRKL